VNARGGRGSDAWPTIGITDYPGERHGPGGGGGGGRVFLSGTGAAVDVSGGSSGTTTLTPEVYGASDGNPGTVSGLYLSQIPGIDTTGVCGGFTASVVDLGVSVAGPPGLVDACRTSSYVFTVVNNGPDAAVNAYVSFPVPSGTTFGSFSPAPGWSCTTPSPGASGTVTCTREVFDLLASSTFTLDLQVACDSAVGAVIAVGGSVGTASTDTYSPNDTTVTANVIGPAITLATRASIRGVRVDRAGRVEFATGWQKGTFAFHVYMSDDPTGREGLVRLTDEPVRTPRPDSQLPIVYSVRTPPVTASSLFIEELERGGRRRLMGPFPVGDRRLEALLARTERRLARTSAETEWDSGPTRARFVGRRPSALAARERSQVEARLAAVRSAGPGASSLRLETAGAGWATVTRAALAAQGLADGLSLRSCRLSSQGQPVAFSVEGEGTPGEALDFRAEALLTTYASRNSYVLSCLDRGPAMAVALTREGDAPRVGWYRLDPTTLYVAHVPQGTDPWLWDQLVPGYGPWPYDWDPSEGTFGLPGWPREGEPTSVRLRVQGMTESRHHVAVTLNGESLGSVDFEGRTSAYLEATASRVFASGNELQIDYDTEEGDPEAYAYLDYLEVQEPEGWSGGPVSVRVLPFQPAPRPPSVDYLVITHPLFAAQAERLAEAKRQEGFEVAVLDVLGLYDRYSGGIPEANAVREAIRAAAAGGRLRYVLLLGDDCFDPDDRAGFGGRTYVPSLDGWDGEFGRVASENRYADVDGDGSPDVAIGRLPASTVEEAQVLVDKVLAQQYLLARGAGRHLFAVDNHGPGDPDFGAAAREAAAWLPRDAVRSFADVGQGIDTARSRLWSALAQGASFTHYFGHGGPETWADEGLLTVEDAASLPATGTVVLTWACEAQFFQYLFGPSVNESLVLKPGGGAVAAFGPDGITAEPVQAVLYQRLYEELSRGPVRLGEAIRRAKARALGDEPFSRAAVDGWNLLGDPSLLVGFRGPARAPEAITNAGARLPGATARR
jgi:uncharacterized repeat protein (TIGR01451 family)